MMSNMASNLEPRGDGRFSGARFEAWYSWPHGEHDIKRGPSSMPCHAYSWSCPQASLTMIYILFALASHFVLSTSVTFISRVASIYAYLVPLCLFFFSDAKIVNGLESLFSFPSIKLGSFWISFMNVCFKWTFLAAWIAFFSYWA